MSSDEARALAGGRAQQPDAQTVRRFEALILPHADAAYRLALRLTRQAEAAEDVTHDAMLRALTSFASFRGGDGLAFILTVVRRRAYDWLRERKLKATASLTLAAADDPDLDLDYDPPDLDQETPEQALMRKDEAAGLRAAVDALPPRLREVLVLREVEDLSYREIADITGAPIGSVMSRLARARALLGQAWRLRQAGSEGQA